MPAKDVKAYVKRAHMAELGIVAALPPAESSRGTSPIQAAKSRPDRKAFGSTTVAAMAVAPITPIPGMVSSRLLVSFASGAAQ